MVLISRSILEQVWFDFDNFVSMDAAMAAMEMATAAGLTGHLSAEQETRAYDRNNRPFKDLPSNPGVVFLIPGSNGVKHKSDRSQEFVFRGITVTGIRFAELPTDGAGPVQALKTVPGFTAIIKAVPTQLVNSLLPPYRSL